MCIKIMTRRNTTLLHQASHFKFGENWINYAESIDEARIVQAIVDLQRLSGRPRLDGVSFLDIGCGSGLHALAAARLGATRIVGIDLDPDSITASRHTLERFAPSAPVVFETRSVFDLSAVYFGTFDVVYSWGVLHHTGDMDRAIACAAELVSTNGVFLFALYKRTLFCPIWRYFKHWYSNMPAESQDAARRRYIALKRFWSELHGRDFDKYIKQYSKARGMDFYSDVHDWLGGYPYQSISPMRCHKLMAQLGFVLEREFVAASGWRRLRLLGSVCDEYAFRRE